MSIFIKIILLLFGLAYLISPVDIIPEMLIPYFGWLDDGVVLWTIYYLIRHGQLPWFLFNRKPPFPGGGNPPRPDGFGTRKNNTCSFHGPSGAKGHAQRKRDCFNSSHDDRNRKATAHEILGLGPHATWEEVQVAYRENIKKFHPDKVTHLGREFSDLANKKFLEIQNAYETLKNKMGR